MKKRLEFTFISNLITLLVSLFLFKPFFEEMDDTLLAMIMEGAFGKRDNHLIYSFFPLGCIESALQGICPAVRWHSVLQYFFLFIAFCLVTYILLRLKNGKALSVVFQMAAGYETYVALQFVKTAAFIGGCGLFVLLILVRDYCLQDDNGCIFESKTERVILSTLAVISELYAYNLRYKAAALAVCAFGLIGFCSFCRIVKERKDTKWTMYLKCFVPLLIVFVILPFVEKAIYNSNDEWRTYLDYNNARTLMVDRRTDALDYNKNADTLKQVGVSENDTIMYLTYMLPDTDEIDADDIRNIIAAQPPKEGGIKALKEWLRNIYDTLFVLSETIIALIILLVFAAITYKRDSFLECIIQIPAIAAVLVYIQYCGRWNHRLVFAVVLIELIVSLYIISCPATGWERAADIEEKRDGSFTTIMVLTVCILAFCLIGKWMGNRFEYNAYMRNKEKINYDILQEYVEENKDVLYCADTFTLQNIFKYKVFSPMREGQCENVIACGSGMTNSPIANAQTEKYGYNNPIQALKSGNDNVCLIDNNSPDKKVLYLTEHGNGRKYSSVLLDSVGGFKIYKISFEE